MINKAARQKAYDKGVWSEVLAVEHLQKLKYEILEQRYKTKFGEIDIIARNKDGLIFVEVKARSSRDEGLYAINYRSRRRIEQAALYYISLNEELVELGMRFDVIVVSQEKNPALVSGNKSNICIEHLDNAWIAGQ